MLLTIWNSNRIMKIIAYITRNDIPVAIPNHWWQWVFRHSAPALPLLRRRSARLKKESCKHFKSRAIYNTVTIGPKEVRKKGRAGSKFELMQDTTDAVRIQGGWLYASCTSIFEIAIMPLWRTHLHSSQSEDDASSSNGPNTDTKFVNRFSKSPGLMFVG